MDEIDHLEVVKEVEKEVARDDNPKSVTDVSHEDFPQTDTNSKFTFNSRN